MGQGACQFPDRLLLSAAQRQVMFAHAQNCLPEEACGVLGGLLEENGRTARVQRILLVENALHSPVRFSMAPLEQLKAFQVLETSGFELVAFFHSHPKGPHQPSPTDLSEFAYPGVLSLILFPSTAGVWQVRAFAIQGVFAPDLAYTEVPIDGAGS